MGWKGLGFAPELKARIADRLTFPARTLECDRTPFTACALLLGNLGICNPNLAEQETPQNSHAPVAKKYAIPGFPTSKAFPKNFH